MTSEITICRKIKTLHPESGKRGVIIDKVKYDTMRDAIVQILEDNGRMSFTDLMVAVETRLDGNIDGSIGSYYVTVKLDFEVRGILPRIAGSYPQKLRLTS